MSKASLKFAFSGDNWSQFLNLCMKFSAVSFRWHLLYLSNRDDNDKKHVFYK